MLANELGRNTHVGKTRRTFLKVVGGGALAIDPILRAFGATQQGANAPEAVTAETACGKVRGASVEGVSIFRGVPYGGPTEGVNRFLPPAKLAKWTSVRDAIQKGPRCYQGGGDQNLFMDSVIGSYFSGGRANPAELTLEPQSENCLVLNVLTPGLRQKLPVMVYIHGGGFTQGSNTLTLISDRFVREQDVVLVGVNHRLSVFGYTYWGGLSEKYAVGNPGQLDLIAALGWVRENIANFGGDPGNVTIFGESGGGGKVSTLLAMPAAKGLFHRAIVQSGSMLKAGDVDAATRRAKDILSKLGVSKLEGLANVSTADLYKASMGGGAAAAAATPATGNARGRGTAGLALGAVAPVVDGHSLPHQTWDPAAPPEATGVSMIIGNCKDESTLFTQNQALFNLDDASLRDALAKAGLPGDNVDPLLHLYKRDHPTETPSDLYFRISADRGARRNAVRQAELKIAQGQGNVYIYYFQWDTPVAGGKLRAWHTSDLPLEMRLVLYPEAEQLSKQLSAAWANFARTGNPSQKGLEWPAYTTSKRSVMMWDAKKSAAVNDPDSHERTALLDLPSGGLL
jgi:para-nitrobenzyl esterase